MNEAQTVPAPLVRMAELVMNDVAALGWDQGARLYLVVGTPEEPSLVLWAMQLEGHPYDLLDIMEPLPREAALKGVLGIALMTEAWAVQPTKERFDEMVAKAGEAWDGLVAQYGSEVMGDRDDFAKKTVQTYLQAYPPVDHPERVELRQICVHTRDGNGLIHFAPRDREPETFGFDQIGGRMKDQIVRLVSRLAASN